jgi:predicted 2-oxoglutarate/Fe(II)-dependent dioxygenase YbiX
MAQEFVKVARYNPQPVVAEYGMYANADGIALLRTLRDAGAETWWFDGDHTAAFGAWQAENVKATRVMEDAHWRHVVNIINANMEAVTEFFGTNIARTIEAGPTHILPAETFRAMFGEGS